MIDEFKYILEKYFEKLGKKIDRNKIVIIRYEEIDGYVIGYLNLSFLDSCFYKIIYYKNINEFVLEEYQIKKSCRITKK
jgi:hypothetical protein